MWNKLDRFWYPGVVVHVYIMHLQRHVRMSFRYICDQVPVRILVMPVDEAFESLERYLQEICLQIYMESHKKFTNLIVFIMKFPGYDSASSYSSYLLRQEYLKIQKEDKLILQENRKKFSITDVVSIRHVELVRSDLQRTMVGHKLFGSLIYGYEQKWKPGHVPLCRAQSLGVQK